MTFENFLWFTLCAMIALVEITCLLLMAGALAWSIYTIAKEIRRIFRAG